MCEFQTKAYDKLFTNDPDATNLAITDYNKVLPMRG